jgi:hypothetical protein
MFVRGITLSLATLLATGVMVEHASADHERGYYPGPPIIREIPGLRILFGDYALSEEEFDELYGTPRRAYRYYDDEPEPRSQTRRARERERELQKRKERQKQIQKQKQKSKTAAKPAKPAEPKKTATKTAAASGLSCEKATSVVTGYGFSSVTPSSCSGKVYAFNATRDGKAFAIKLNSANGELTEVKKLP